jgi:hypothetical protein
MEVATRSEVADTKGSTATTHIPTCLFPLGFWTRICPLLASPQPQDVGKADPGTYVGSLRSWSRWEVKFKVLVVGCML